MLLCRCAFGGGVGVGVGVMDAEKMSDNCLMASMIWAPKREKGAASAGLGRVLARPLATSVAESVEGIVGMAPLWGELYRFCCDPFPCLWIIDAVALVVEWGCANAQPYLAMEIPCLPLLWCFVNEDFFSLVGPWGSCCSQTSHLYRPPQEVKGLSGISAGGLGFVWPMGGCFTKNALEIWGLPH